MRLYRVPCHETALYHALCPARDGDPVTLRTWGRILSDTAPWASRTRQGRANHERGLGVRGRSIDPSRQGVTDRGQGAPGRESARYVRCQRARPDQSDGTHTGGFPMAYLSLGPIHGSSFSGVGVGGMERAYLPYRLLKAGRYQV